MDWNNLNHRRAFLEIFNALCELHKRSLSEALLKLYFQALSGFSVEQVVRAIETHILEADSGAFFPKPADLKAVLAGRTEDLAMVQASTVLTAVRRIGGYGSVVFDDPVTQAVIVRNFGGWERLCGDLAEENEKWMQKDFAEAYASFRRQGIRHYGHLSGRAERENSAACIENAENIAFIGDLAKAREVYLKGGKVMGSFQATSLPAPEKTSGLEPVGKVVDFSALVEGIQRVGNGSQEKARAMQSALAETFKTEMAI